MANALDAENFWTQKTLYNEAEKNYVMHISKLLSGCLEKDKKRNSGTKGSISQTVAIPSAPNASKKEKERKNKQINKAVNVEGNVKVVQVQRVPASPRKLPIEREVENKDVINTVNTHPNKKSKKDRRWYHATKTNNSEDEELSLKNVKASVNGSAKGVGHAQDEKKAGSGANQGTLVSEIAKARQHIKNSLERMDGIAALAAASPGGDVLQRLSVLETENKNLVELTNLLKKTLSETQNRVLALETRLNTLSISGTAAVAPVAPANGTATVKSEPAEDDDDVDLFGSESEGEDEAAAKIREQRLAEYAAKKSKKPALIAKSSLVLDIKPWSDETDLKAMEEEVRKITSEGLLWGASKLVPVAFGIKKLTISCVVEDEKVSIDWLTEQIEAIEEHVQSVDVAAFNKI